MRDKIRFALVLICFASFNSEAFEVDKVSAVVGWSKPPYVIQVDDSGFELELIESVFKMSNIDVSFSYVPYGRTPWLITQNQFDVALTISPKHDVRGAFLSESYISYQNVVVKLKTTDVKIDEIADLGKFSIAGFQNATKVLGDEFKKMGSDNALYFEVPDQKHQVELLLIERVDFIVLDVNIFNYISKSISGRNFMEKVDVYYFFPESKYHLGCKKKWVCDKFNESLKTFKNSTAYEGLQLKYDFVHSNKS